MAHHLLIIGVATTIMATAGSAFAADMAVRSAPPAYSAAPPAYSAYDWGGAYIGGVIGDAWGETDSSDPNFGVLGARVGVPGVQPTFSSGFIASSVSWWWAPKPISLGAASMEPAPPTGFRWAS